MADAPLSPRRRVSTAVLLGLKLLLSFGLLALLLHWINVPEMAREFTNLRWGWVILGLALHQLQATLSSVKWKIVLAADGLRVRFLFLLKTHLIGGFLSLFLPTSFGGDVYRVLALHRHGAKMSKSAASVLFDRVMGLLALLTIGIAGCLLLLDSRAALLLLLVYVGGIALFLTITSDAVVSRLPHIQSMYLGFPLRILRSFNVYRRCPKVLAATAGLSLSFQFNVVLIVTCYARALNIAPADVTFLELVAVLPLIFLSEVLPSINGIGVRDGAFVFFFPLVGGTAEQGLALSLLVIALRYVQASVGGVLFAVTLLRGTSPVPIHAAVVATETIAE
jgi:glycosyltransferase 2 family protein